MPDEVSKKAKEILNRYEILKSVRNNWQELWKECEFAVAPVSKEWDDEKPHAPYKLPERETSFPTNCMNTCCTGLAGYAISPSSRWFKLTLNNGRLKDETDVSQWLEQCEDVLRAMFEKAGLYKKAIQWIKLSCIYGHSAMLIEEVQNSDTPLRYHVVENQELYLDLNDIGEVDKVYRYYWTDAENIVTRYGKKAMSKKFLEKYEKWEEARDSGAAVAPIDVKILHAVELRRTGKSNPEETVANKKWASYIIDIEHKHIIKESGYDEFPYAVFYWEHNGKPYGLSPTISGMRDIQFYQEYYSAYNIAVQNIIDPPMVQTPGITHWDYSPGGRTVVPNMQQVPQPIVKEDLGSLLSQKAEFEQRVKEWFYVDFFIMLRQREGLGEMTATAVAAMQGEQVALLSSIVANFYQELDKIVERTFNILAKRGMLPPMPLSLQRLGGALKIHHLGILAQAQQKLYESGGVADYMTLVAQFAELAKIDPEFAKAIGWVDPHSVFRGVMAARDIPSNFLKTPDEYKAWVEATDQKAAAMAEREAAAMENQALLQNAKNLSQKPAPGSPLEHLFTPKGNTLLN